MWHPIYDFLTNSWWANSNFGGLIMGVAIPTIPTWFWIHHKQKQTHKKMDEHHARLRAHLGIQDEPTQEVQQ